MYHTQLVLLRVLALGTESLTGKCMLCICKRIPDQHVYAAHLQAAAIRLLHGLIFVDNMKRLRYPHPWRQNSVSSYPLDGVVRSTLALSTRFWGFAALSLTRLDDMESGSALHKLSPCSSCSFLAHALDSALAASSWYSRALTYCSWHFVFQNQKILQDTDLIMEGCHLRCPKAVMLLPTYRFHMVRW